MQGAHFSVQLLRDDAQEFCRQRRELEAALGWCAAAGQGMVHAACCSHALRQTYNRALRESEPSGAANASRPASQGHCPQYAICNGTA